MSRLRPAWTGPCVSADAPAPDSNASSDQHALVDGMPRRRAFRRARAARPPDVAERPATLGDVFDEQADETPGTHVLGLFLHPDDLFERRKAFDYGLHVGPGETDRAARPGRSRSRGVAPGVRSRPGRRRSCRCTAAGAGCREAALRLRHRGLPAASGLQRGPSGGWRPSGGAAGSWASTRRAADGSVRSSTA